MTRSQAVRSRKSENAYRTISEVAGEIDVPAHVLRFWETKFPSVKPLKRGGGRRYYRPEDIDALRRIRNLLYDDGLTIRGVQKLLKTHGGKPPAGIASEVAPSTRRRRLLQPNRLLKWRASRS